MSECVAHEIVTAFVSIIGTLAATYLAVVTLKAHTKGKDDDKGSGG